MVRMLQQFGRDKCIVFTPDMIEHLGIGDAVEISFEEGRIVITKPSPEALKQSGREDFQEAARRTIEQYRPAFETLAGMRDDTGPLDEE